MRTSFSLVSTTSIGVDMIQCVLLVVDGSVNEVVFLGDAVFKEGY